MVGKRLFSALNKEIGNVHRAAYVLAGFTLLSQILALFRDRLLAYVFGAGSTLDVYYAAFRIPDLIFVSAASIVSISVLVPILSKKISQNTLTEAQDFIRSVTTMFLVIIVVVSTVMFFLLPYIQPLIFRGFTPEQLDEVIKLSRILLLSPIFLGLSNILAGVTQTFKRFFVYALSPILYNLGIIFGILVLQKSYGITGVVFGVVFGAFLHFAVQLPFVIHTRLVPKLSTRVNILEVWSVIKSSLPRTVTLGMSHFIILILLSIASGMRDGSIAVFNLSFNLQSVPLSIVGVSYSLAAFPTLSRLFVEGKIKEYVSDITIATRHIIFWSLPVMSLFIVLRAQIVRVILGSGSFDWADTRLTAAALSFFVISVLFQNVILLYVRGFYAAGRTYIPLVISIVSGVTAVTSAIVLSKIYLHFSSFKNVIEALFRVEGVSGTEVLMLPLAFTVGSIVNGVLLILIFRRIFTLDTKLISKGLFESGIGALCMGAAAYFSLNVLDTILDIQTTLGIFLQGFTSGIAGLVIGIGVLYLFKNKELKEIFGALKKRYGKMIKIAGPDVDMVG